MWSCMSVDWNGHDVATSWWNSEAEAVENAERNMGVVRVVNWSEEGGSRVVWER
jgi:hypothetical protein